MSAHGSNDSPASSTEPIESERLVDPSTDDPLPEELDVGPEIPVPDAIDQRRAVVLDDDQDR